MKKAKWNYGLKDVVEDEDVEMSKIKRFFKWLIFPAYFRYTELNYIAVSCGGIYPYDYASLTSRSSLFSRIKSKVQRALLIDTVESSPDKDTLLQEYRKSKEDCLALWLGYKSQKECPAEDDSKNPEWLSHPQFSELSRELSGENTFLLRALGLSDEPKDRCQIYPCNSPVPAIISQE